MPKIPEFRPDLIVRTPMADAGPMERYFGVVRRATAGLVNMFGNIEQNIFQSIEEEQKSERATRALAIEDQMNKDDQETLTDIATASNYETVEEETEKRINKNVNKYLEMTKGDPDLALAVNKALVSRNNNLRSNARSRKLSLRADYAKSSFDDIYEDYLKKYSTFRDQFPGESDEAYFSEKEKQKALLRQSIEGIGQATVENFGLRQEYIRDKLSKFTSDATVYEVLAENETSPSILMLKLSERNPDGTYKHYQDLNPIQRAALTDRNLSKINQRDTMIEKIKKESREDQLKKIGQLYLDDKFDEMLRELRNPFLHDTDVRTWKSVIDTKKEDFQNDVQTEYELTMGIYGPTLRKNLNDINKAYIEKRINYKTFAKMLEHYAGRVDSLRKEWKNDSEKIRDKTFEHNEKSIAMSLQVTGPGSQFVIRDVNAIHSTALTEYFNLVYGPDKIDPNEAKDIIINKYGPSVDDISSREAKTLRKTIPHPNNETADVGEMILWYKEQEKIGRMPKASVDAGLRTLMDIEGLESRKKKQQQEQQNKEIGKKPKYVVPRKP